MKNLYKLLSAYLIGALALSSFFLLPPKKAEAAVLPTTNLVARYIAGTGVTESGGRISQWNDQSGSGYNLTQATSTNQPYNTTDYLGRPVVRFTQTGVNYLTIPSGLTLNSRSQSIWIVKIGGGGSISLFSANGQTAGLIRYQGTPTTLTAGSRVSTFAPVLQPEIVGVTLNNASSTIYTTSSSSPQSALNAGTGGGGFIGVFTGGSSSSFSGDMYEILVYSGVQSAQDVADTRAYLTETYTLPTSLNRQILFEGDSITAGSGLTGADLNYPRQLYGLAGETNGWQFINNSISGSTITSMSTRTAGEDSTYYNPAFSKNVLMVLIGRNDVTTADNSATVYSNLVTYVQGRVAAGWEVWVGTPIATGSSLQPTIDALNAKIRGTTGNGIVADAGASKIIDFAANTNFDQTSDSGSANYQGDATHPSHAGASIMASIVAPYLDATTPIISSISSGTPTQTSATITWTTNEASNSQINYGLSSSYTASSTLNTATTTSHSETITGLTANTTYHYRVRSTDFAGNIATSSDQTFTTASVADAVVPTVSLTAPTNGITISGSNVSITANASDNVGVSGVQFKLDTNTNIGAEDTTSTYGVTWNSTLVSEGTHTIIAVARDAAGNYATSSPITVTVDNTTAPAFSSISAGTPSTTGATITWTTDENSTSQVIYGLSTSYTATTTLDASLVTSHSVVLSGLSAGTTYHYRVISKDSLNNTSTSTDQTFTTTSISVTPPSSSGNASQSSGSGGYIGGYNPFTPIIATPIPCISGALFNTSTGAPCTKISSPATTAPNVWLFTRDLQLGTVHPEVKLLQRYLNTNGYTVSSAGAGSVGGETTFFGLLTRAALIKFQKAKNILPSAGYFGAITRKFISTH